MRQHKERPTIGTFFRSRLFLVGVLIVVLLVAFGYARAYYKDYKIREEIRTLEGEVRLLEHKKLESLEILEYVTSDAFVEEKARTELNLKKPGEHVVVVSDPLETTLASAKQEPATPLSNPVKWWYYLTHQEVPKGEGK